MVALNSIRKSSAKSVSQMDTIEILDGAVKRSLRKVGKIGRFVIWRFRKGPNEWEWHAVDEKTQVSQVYVNGFFDDAGDILNISELYKVKGGAVRAHDLYYFLLKTRQVKGLAGKSHSAGAVRVWQRLVKMKGVFVYGWHSKEPVWIDPRSVGGRKTHSRENKKIEDTIMIVGYNG